MSKTLEWKEPPPELSRGRGKHHEVVELLKGKPGEWARVQTDMSSSGASEPWRKRGCEVATRPAESGKEGKRDIYARWPAPEQDVKAEEQRERHAAAEPALLKRKPDDSPEPGGPPTRWTVNGKVRTDPPPTPLPVPEGETAAEARTRKSADRIAMDRWKRGVPVEGTSILAGRHG